MIKINDRPWIRSLVQRINNFYIKRSDLIVAVSCALGISAGALTALGVFHTATVLALASMSFSFFGKLISKEFIRKNFTFEETVGCILSRQIEVCVLSGLVIYYKESPIFQAILLFALLGCLMTSYASVLAEAKRTKVLGLSTSFRCFEKILYLSLGPVLSFDLSAWMSGSPIPVTVMTTFLLVLILIIIAAIAITVNVHAIRQFAFTFKNIKQRLVPEPLPAGMLLKQRAKSYVMKTGTEN